MSRSRWSILVAAVLAVVLLYLAVRGINWRELWATIRRAHLGYLVLTVAFSHLAYVLRSLRWRVLLSAERPVSPVTVFWATMLGYLGNNFLPARAGEVIRSVALGSKAGLGRSWVFATALTERLLDVIALILISLVALLVTGRLSVATSGATEQSAWLVKAWRILGVLALLGLLVTIVLPRLERWLRRALGRIPLPERLSEKLLGVLSQFLLGMRAFQHPARGVKFSFFTLAIWLADGVGSVLCAKALGLSMSLPVALVFLAAIGLSSAVPSTPGYIGIYQFVAVTVLPQFGLDRSSALAFILVAQGLSYLVVTVWGLVGLWRLGPLFRPRCRNHDEPPGPPDEAAAGR